MPVLKNSRHEIIANEIAVNSKTWTDAMKIAGYSSESVRTQTKRMSENVVLRERIVELRSEITHKATWDAAKVLQRLAEIVDADIQDIYTESGKLKPLTAWPLYWRRLVTRVDNEQKFERSKDGGEASWDPSAELLKVHTVDRLKALEMIGRHKAVDAFVKQVAQIDINVNISEDILKALAEGRERASQLRLVDKVG